MPTDRHDQLLTPIDTLLTAHRVWQESDNPELSREFIDRIEDAITVFSGGDMPGDLLDLYAKVRSMDEAWTEAVMQADDPEHIQTAKCPRFWKTMEAVRQLRERAEEEEMSEPRPLESVAMLTAQKVPDQQICWIYRATWAPGAKTGPGLWDQRKNRPMLDRLQKERDQAGSIITADFVPWYAAQRMAEAERRKMAADRAAAAREERIAKVAKPCPESLEELVNQGVSLTQIAQMKKATKATIRKQCLDQGLAVPPDEYEQPRSDYAPELNEAQVRIDQAERPLPRKRKDTETRREDAETEDAAPPADDAAGDDFGGSIDDSAEPEEPVTAEERLVAQWMDAGATAAAEIAKSIASDGGPSLKAGEVKAIIGRLKGDPDRMTAALGN